MKAEPRHRVLVEKEEFEPMHWIFPPWQLLLAISAPLLDLRAVALPVTGTFTTSFVPCLIVLLHPESSLGLAWLTLALCLVCRMLVDNRPQKVSMSSLCPDLVAFAIATAVSLGAHHWTASIPGLPILCQILAVGSWLTAYSWASKKCLRLYPETTQTAALRISLATRELQTYATVLSLVMLQLRPTSDQWWLGMALCIPLLGIHRAAENAVFRLQAQSASSALAQFSSLKRTAEHSQNKTYQKEQALQQTRSEKLFIEELHSQLSNESDLLSAYKYVLDAGARFIKAESLAIFERGEQGEIWERICLGPYERNFVHAKLLQLEEPQVEACFRIGVSQFGDRPSISRIFSGESASVAVPLGRYAVFYAGRTSGPYTPKEVQTLEWLCGRAGLSLQLLYEKLLETARRHATLRVTQELTGRVSLLSELLESSQCFSSALDWTSVAVHFEQRLSKLITTEWAVVVDAEGHTLVTGVKCVSTLSLPPIDYKAALARDVTFVHHKFGSESGIIACLRLRHTQSLLVLNATRKPSQEEMQALTVFSNLLDLAISNIQYIQKVVDTQKYLLQSNKLSAVGQLAAGVAHEFNSPFGAIRIVLEAVKASPEGGPFKKKMERSLRSLERCQAIVDKLTVFTNLGDDPIETLDLVAQAKDTLSFFHSHLGLDLCKLECHWASAIQVRCRVRDLQQILLGLLLNAVESYHTLPDREKKILVTSGAEAGKAWICIEDEGCGIASADLERVFEPFFTNKVIGKNIGLGLTVARELIESHSGNIAIDSELDKGTRSTLYLPLVAPQSP